MPMETLLIQPPAQRLIKGMSYTRSPTKKGNKYAKEMPLNLHSMAFPGRGRGQGDKIYYAAIECLGQFGTFGRAQQVAHIPNRARFRLMSVRMKQSIRSSICFEHSSRRPCKIGLCWSACAWVGREWFNVRINGWHRWELNAKAASTV